MNRAVDRRAGLGQNAGDAERLVVVLDERHRAEPVRDDDLVADLVAERAGHVGADHGVEEVVEGLTVEAELLAAAVLVACEILRRRAEHAEAAMAVAERQRHGPGDLRALGRSPHSSAR